MVLECMCNTIEVAYGIDASCLGGGGAMVGLAYPVARLDCQS